MTASGVAKVPPGSSVQVKVFGLMPSRTRAVSNMPTSTSARKLPE